MKNRKLIFIGGVVGAVDGYLRWFLQKDKGNLGFNIKVGANVVSALGIMGFGIYSIGGYRLLPSQYWGVSFGPIKVGVALGFKP